jgi:hypothetical protein
MEKWTTQNRLDGSLSGSLFLGDFSFQLYYYYEPEDKYYHLYVGQHSVLHIFGIRQTHQYLQSRLLGLARERLSKALQEIIQIESIDFSEVQEDVGQEENTGIELKMDHVLDEMGFLAKDISRITRKGKKKTLTESDRGLLDDYVACYVAYSEAKQKLLKGERAFVPWFHYRID